MSDPQPATYPGFEMTAEGLGKMHQALGMYLHQTLELNAARQRDEARHQQEMEALAQQFARAAAPQASEANVTEPTPIKPPKAAAQGG